MRPAPKGPAEGPCHAEKHFDYVIGDPTHSLSAESGLRPAPKGPAEGPCHADHHTDSMTLKINMQQQQQQLQVNEQPR